jgi:hypothetical protein
MPHLAHLLAVVEVTVTFARHGGNQTQAERFLLELVGCQPHIDRKAIHFNQLDQGVLVHHAR